MKHLKRPLLLASGLLCLGAAFLPGSTASLHGRTSECRLGLPSSPIFTYRREEIDSADQVRSFGEGARIEASSVSGYRSEWRIDVFSWSMALAVAGLTLVAMSFRRRRPAEVR